MRPIDADALLEGVQRKENALRNELIVSAHNTEICNNSRIRLSEVLSIEHKIKYAPTVEEKPRGEIKKANKMILTDMQDSSIMPQMVERVAHECAEEKERYIMRVSSELKIDKDVLKNQAKEIQRLNNLLQEYKDLEEQGLLLMLPCKVGDTVYQIRNKRHAEGIGIAERMVSCINIYSTNNYSLLHQGMIECYSRELNKTWFLTREEAEAKLKEMEGNA